MHSLAREILDQYHRQFSYRQRIINEWAALKGGLFESNVGGSPYVGLNALVLSSPEKISLEKISNSIGGIMARALEEIIKEGPKTFRQLGWPENLDYALINEPLNLFLTAIGRFDFLLDLDGCWRLLEFNSDTPSGSQEVTLIEEKLFPFLSRLARVKRLNPQIKREMAEALLNEAKFPPLPQGAVPGEGPFLPPRIGFITQSRHITDLAQVEFYSAVLKELGLECVVGDLLNVSLAGGELLVLGQPVDALWRLIPIEIMGHSPLFAAYTRANQLGFFKVINNLRGFLAQNKGVLAWLWKEKDNAQIFNPEERTILKTHLPETYLLSSLSPNFDFKDFIIKEFYGREGAEVYDGSLLTPAQWRQCQEWGTFVAQRRVVSSSFPHSLMTDRGKPELIEAYPCIGSFLIGGKWGGCYSRIGSKITNYQAQFVPTFLAGAGE